MAVVSLKSRIGVHKVIVFTNMSSGATTSSQRPAAKKKTADPAVVVERDDDSESFDSCLDNGLDSGLDSGEDRVEVDLDLSGVMGPVLELVEKTGVFIQPAKLKALKDGRMRSKEIGYIFRKLDQAKQKADIILNNGTVTNKTLYNAPAMNCLIPNQAPTFLRERVEWSEGKGYMWPLTDDQVREFTVFKAINDRIERDLESQKHRHHAEMARMVKTVKTTVNRQLAAMKLTA